MQGRPGRPIRVRGIINSSFNLASTFNLALSQKNATEVTHMAQEAAAQKKTLESILPAQLRPGLSEAERRVLKSAPTGDWAVAGENSDDKSNDPKNSQTWGPERNIRADVIRWICTDRDATNLVDAEGLLIYGARIMGFPDMSYSLDLSYLKVPFPLAFQRCVFNELIHMESTTVPSLYFGGSLVASIKADNAKIDGYVSLGDHFSSRGEVSFYNTRIGGDFYCAGGTFKNSGGRALMAGQAVIGGAAVLNGGFSSEGSVILYGANISGDLDCTGAKLENPGGTALDVRTAQINGSIRLSGGVETKGEVALYGVQLKSDLDCSQGSFNNPKGTSLSADEAVIGGAVLLNGGFHSLGGVSLYGAHTSGDLACNGARLENPGGTALDARTSQIAGSAYLNSGFTAKGGVDLYGAQIKGDLNCWQGSFNNSQGISLKADQAVVDGAVLLDGGFHSIGGVSLYGMHLSGDLNCGDGSFVNPKNISLNAEDVTIGGAVYLSGKFHSVGEVRFYGSHINGDLDCTGARLENPGGQALYAESLETGGSVFLRKLFSAEGKVDLMGAHIAGDLDCENGVFANPQDQALGGERVEVGSSLYLRKGFAASGEVSFRGAHVGIDLDCDGGRFSGLDLSEVTVKEQFLWEDVKGINKLSLNDASVGDMLSDKTSWPKKVNGSPSLDLDGFVYGDIWDDLEDPKWRLEWLESSNFSARAYRQLAKALRDRGDDEGSKEVLMALESKTRAAARSGSGLNTRNWWVNGEDKFSKATVGYGYFPEWAIREMCCLTVLGWIIFRRAKIQGAMAPTDKDAYENLKNKQPLPNSYPPFNSFVYSFENCIPLLKLGQDEKWQPDPQSPGVSPPVPAPHRLRRLRDWFRRVEDGICKYTVDLVIRPGFLRWARWLMIVVGWLLATFFVAGLSGIIHNN